MAPSALADFAVRFKNFSRLRVQFMLRAITVVADDKQGLAVGGAIQTVRAEGAVRTGCDIPIFEPPAGIPACSAERCFVPSPVPPEI